MKWMVLDQSPLEEGSNPEAALQLLASLAASKGLRSPASDGSSQRSTKQGFSLCYSCQLAQSLAALGLSQTACTVMQAVTRLNSRGKLESHRPPSVCPPPKVSSSTAQGSERAQACQTATVRPGGAECVGKQGYKSAVLTTIPEHVTTF